jgi:hypothetical protein
VSIEGGMIKLRAPRRYGDHWIGLEPEVLQNFIDYLKAKRILKTGTAP